MSEPSAITAALSRPPGEHWPEVPKPGGGRSGKKFLFWVAFVLAFHLALIVLFGTKKQFAPRLVANVPHLQLANNADELIALGDPTLFARPNMHDLVTTFWRQPPVITPVEFNLVQAPHYLLPASENLGTALQKFIQASRPPEFSLNFKPEPKPTAPLVAADDSPAVTTMQITGDLSRRRLLNVPALPALRISDVIAPSKVQALVDPAGDVVSAVLLPLNSAQEEAGRSAAGDTNALAIVRSLQFAPASRLTFGEIVFHWHTVPLADTKTP